MPLACPIGLVRIYATFVCRAAEHLRLTVVIYPCYDGMQLCCITVRDSDMFHWAWSSDICGYTMRRHYVLNLLTCVGNRRDPALPIKFPASCMAGPLACQCQCSIQHRRESPNRQRLFPACANSRRSRPTRNSVRSNEGSQESAVPRSPNTGGFKFRQ
jgi:hypothetical protein